MNESPAGRAADVAWFTASVRHRTRRATSGARPVPLTALLAIFCLAQFMVLLDVSIVNVALPSIQESLSFSDAGLQWVVSTYTITFGGLLLLGGRAGDLFGHRRIFIIGIVVFGLASFACAVATSRSELLLARAVQGIGSAFVSPATLSLVTTSFPERHERNRAVSMWGAMGALGGSLGALLGGVLTQWLGWPAIFAVNVPIALVVLAGTLRSVPRDRHVPRRGGLDVAGAVLATFGFAALTYAIVRSDSLGWLSVGVLVPFAAAAACLLGFGFVEGRIATAPLVPLHVFRLRHLRAANLIVALIYAAFFPMWFFLTLYLQSVLHFSVALTGVLFLPLGLAVFVMSVLAPRLVSRHGHRAVITGGMLTAAAGLALMTQIAPGKSHAWYGLLGGFLMMAGLGLSLVPSTIVATSGLPAGMAGLGSALMNTSRLLGGALGLAILTTIATGLAHGSSPDAMTHGFAVGLAVSAAVCVTGAIVAVTTLREVRATDELPVRT